MRNMGFDNEKYVRLQTAGIRERIDRFGDKLYIEFGGKLFDDFNASRVLPGFHANAKVQILQELRGSVEIILSISAEDIVKRKVRADLGITYDMEVLRLMDSLRDLGLYVSAVAVTQYKGQPEADVFTKKLEMRKEKVYLLKYIEGYPTDIDHVVSENGFGVNPYVETTYPIVVVAAPGPGSGKLVVCLSQLYHENLRGVKAGYVKFETFPVWNLPHFHPINIAYEAATVELNDSNGIDPFHAAAYNITAVNYNRDIAVFPVVKSILGRLSDVVYQSPTDMGINTVGFCITDDDVCKEAAKQEIIRRYYCAKCDYAVGKVSASCIEKLCLLMQQLGITEDDRAVAQRALSYKPKSGRPTVAIETVAGVAVTGRKSDVLTASSALLLNILKELAGIDDMVMLLSPEVLKPILNVKKNIFGAKHVALKLDETVSALSVCAATNKRAKKALAQLHMLRGAEVHSTTMLHPAEELVFRNLGVNLTCSAEFPTKDLYFM